MRTHCPNGHVVDLPAERLGTEARCPDCGATFMATATLGGDVEGRDATGATASRTAAGGPAWRRYVDRWNFELLDQLRPAAQFALLLGMMLAIAARGWDTVADGMVRRAQARVDHAETAWRDRWADQFDRITQEESTIRTKDNLSATDRERLDELRSERERLQDEQRADEAAQTASWNELDREARQQESANQMAEPWREILFVIATLFFAVGLLVMGTTSEGPLRWFCLVLLAIVILSVYFGSVWEYGTTRTSGRSI